MSTLVYVDGRPLFNVGAYSRPDYTLAADGGSKVASVQVSGLAPNFVPPAFRRGRSFSIHEGSLPVWHGTVSEFDQAGGVLHAVGAYQAAGRGDQGFLALDGSGGVSSNPHVAIGAAIARGLPWTYNNDFPNVDYAGTATSLNYLRALLDAVAEAEGKRWGVDADGHVYMRADDTAVSWYLAPGLGIVGSADDSFVTHIYGIRVSAQTVGPPPEPTAWATVTVSDAESATDNGRAEVKVDLTTRGLLSAPAATSILDGMLAKAGPRQGVTSALDVASWQLTSLGGVAAHPALVQPQQLVRALGVLGQDGEPVDFVIDEVRPGESTIGITPMNLAARDLMSVLASPAPRAEVFEG